MTCQNLQERAEFEAGELPGGGQAYLKWKMLLEKKQSGHTAQYMLDTKLTDCIMFNCNFKKVWSLRFESKIV